MVAHPVSNRQMMAVGRVAEQWTAMNLTPANADSLPSGNAMGQGDICMMASKKNPAVYREGGYVQYITGVRPVKRSDER